jgi:hypothetical protein
VFYKLRATFALTSIFQYRIGMHVVAVWRACVGASKDIGLVPAEAASMFMEVSCLSMSAPLNEKSAAFVLEKIDRMIYGMRSRKLSAMNCIRVARLYAYARGASSDDANEFAARTIESWDSRGKISEDGTEVADEHPRVGLPLMRLPLLEVLRIEFDVNGPAGLTDEERKEYAEKVTLESRRKTFEMLKSLEETA